jgi:hypothetical protein
LTGIVGYTKFNVYPDPEKVKKMAEAIKINSDQKIEWCLVA